jgi:hypothetical protein
MEGRLRPDMPAVFEHERLSEAIDLATTVDRLNITNLARFEFSDEKDAAISENKGNPNYEGARLFMGPASRVGRALVAPALDACAAGELGEETF